MVFQFFGYTTWEKVKIKFLLASKNHLFLLKILPIVLFRKFVPAFRLPSLTLKIVPKAACDPENCSESRLWSWKLFRKPAMMISTQLQKKNQKEILKCMDRNFILILIEEGIIHLPSGLAYTNAFGSTWSSLTTSRLSFWVTPHGNLFFWGGRGGQECCGTCGHYFAMSPKFIDFLEIFEFFELERFRKLIASRMKVIIIFFCMRQAISFAKKVWQPLERSKKTMIPLSKVICMLPFSNYSKQFWALTWNYFTYCAYWKLHENAWRVNPVASLKKRRQIQLFAIIEFLTLFSSKSNRHILYISFSLSDHPNLMIPPL